LKGWGKESPHKSQEKKNGKEGEKKAPINHRRKKWKGWGKSQYKKDGKDGENHRRKNGKDGENHRRKKMKRMGKRKPLQSFWQELGKQNNQLCLAYIGS
jgi:hypothetical protein